MQTGFIFDIDGTLVDSVDFHAEAWQRAFARYDITVSFDDIRAQIGKGGDELMPVFLSPQQLEQFGEELESYRSSLFRDEYLPRVRGFPKVRELFQHLKAQGSPIVLGSSAKGAELDTYKQAAGIEDLVDDETSSDDVDRSKPHPDIFLEAWKKLGRPPKPSVWVVGDSPYDAIAARKAGFNALGLRCGGFEDDALWEAGYSALFDDPAALLEWLKQTPLREVNESLPAPG